MEGKGRAVTSSELIKVVRGEAMHQESWVHVFEPHLQSLQPRAVRGHFGLLAPAPNGLPDPPEHMLGR